MSLGSRVRLNMCIQYKVVDLQIETSAIFCTSKSEMFKSFCSVEYKVNFAQAWIIRMIGCVLLLLM